MLIERLGALRETARLLRGNPVVALLGARQVGKTTLAREVAQQWRGGSHHFDLERDDDARALEQPFRALEALQGLVVIDEVQRRPELFPALRVLADRPRSAKFLVLGSAAPELLRQTSESLAGRVAYQHLGPLSLAEVGPDRLDRLWLRGGFPRAYTARSDAESFEWRRNFIRTFLERDVPSLAPRVSASALGRLWAMLAHVHGQVLNLSELGRALGVSDKAVRDYVDLLVGTFVVRELKPWHENISKRQVKAPKVYLADSGVLHSLLGLETRGQLERHPRVGASWEGLGLESVIEHLGAHPEECFFWATHGGAELDLLIVSAGRRLGFEFKLSDAPALTPSMRSAMESLRLDALTVIYPGARSFALGAAIRAVPLHRLAAEVPPLRKRR